MGLEATESVINFLAFLVTEVAMLLVKAMRSGKLGVD
jgi:hypothetical protein